VKTNLKDMVPSARGQSGQYLTITITAGISLTGTVGGQVSGDVNAIVAGAKAQVNASIALSLTASVAYSTGWTVPTTWAWGDLHAGGSQDSMSWTYGSYNGACQWIVQRSGTANLPYHIPTFWHTQG
jgi:hypothetical protein